MNNSYCEFCNDFCEYEEKLVKTKTVIDAIEIVYNKTKTYCKECKNEIFVNKVMEKNELELEREYKSIKSRECKCK